MMRAPLGVLAMPACIDLHPAAPGEPNAHSG